MKDVINAWLLISNPNYQKVDLITEDLKKILSSNSEITIEEKGELLGYLLRTSTYDILLPRIKLICGT